MNTTIKNEVKDLFSSLPFEAALEATKGLRGEYIKEFGVKSWNGLVSYYKKANIQPKETMVAEPEPKYDAQVNNDSVIDNEDGTNEDEVIDGVEMMVLHPENVEDLHSLLEEALGEAPASSTGGDAATTDDSTETPECLTSNTDVNGDEPSKTEENSDVEPENVELIDYMIYRNTGDGLEWFGHKENYTHLEEGSVALLIRNHSCGVGMGQVLATANLTYGHISIFHRCYKAISNKRCSYKEQLDMTVKCFRNISSMSTKDLANLPKVDTKLTDQILNFKK